MTPQQLKASLLQEAIRGKLTDQRPEDGSAEELYRAILAEKKRLIKAGKLKKEKPLPPIEEKDIPFDIPENWKWVRLGEIGSWSSGATPQRSNPEYFGGNIPWLKTGDLTDGLVDDVPEYITEKALNETSVKLQPVGAVLIAMYGATIGKLGILTRPMTTNQACCACIPHNGIDRKFLFYFLMASRQKFIERGEGGAQPNISKEKITAFLLPLPPLAEQERIVAKLEELLPLVERYGKAYTQLTALEQRFPASMRKSLLQEAIQGKLTDQRPEDGSAEDLYRSILAEKKRLIKAGKLKKEKPLPPIEEKDIPFDIPENWKWVRLGEVGELKGGYAFKSSEYKEAGIQVVRIADLDEDTISTRDAVYYQEYSKLIPYLVRKGSFLICMTGSLGKMARVLDDTPRYLNQRVGMFVPLASVNDSFLWYFLHTNHVISKWIGDKTGPNGNIKNESITNLLLPLPPLAEQERIVAKLEELLPLCD